jgi:spore maturation protein CgeB
MSQSVKAAVEGWVPDLLFCFKTVRLDQGMLGDVPTSWRLHYSPDDVSNAANVTESYLTHESMWDLIVTTKRHNVEEITSRSGGSAMFVWSAYDHHWHHRMASLSLDRFAVGFIGNARPDRLTLLETVGRHYGRKMLLAGPGWNRHLRFRRHPVTLRSAMYGECLSVGISSVEANLVLLNSDNRDRHTCRSFEVPAAGGLVVAERTDEHLELLDEGTEALYFESEEELLWRLQQVQSDPDRAAAMRLAGWQRITGDRNTYTDRAHEILAAIDVNYTSAFSIARMT